MNAGQSILSPRIKTNLEDKSQKNGPLLFCAALLYFRVDSRNSRLSSVYLRLSASTCPEVHAE